MFYSLATIAMFANAICFTSCKLCQKKCPTENVDMVCAYDQLNRTYKMFPSKCALDGYRECIAATDLVETPLKFCIKDQKSKSRKMYGQSCPVFCPNHYRPVCGANNFRSYVYRTFINGCYFDMLNCRGDEDFSAYTEVPLEFCTRHLSKNIFKEQVVMSSVKDYQDYN